MIAIANVYEEALRQDKDSSKVNPLELWDLHQIRRLDDSGFIKSLYEPREAPKAVVSSPAPGIEEVAERRHAHETNVLSHTKKGAPMPDHECDETCAGTH